MNGIRNRANYIRNTEMLLSTSGMLNMSQPPNWDEAVYIYEGSSNSSSYNYTRPEAYRRKDERPGTTGVYKREYSLSQQASLVMSLATIGKK